MANCIMCDKTVDNYPGYITDGVISVCNDCASSNSLMRVMTRIKNSGKPANIKSVFSPLIEVGLVDQTGERVELDKDKLDAKRELNKKYGMAVNAYTDEELKDVKAYEAKYHPGSEFMDGVKAYLESGLVDQTKATIDYVGGFSSSAAIHHIFDECEQVWLKSHDKSEVHNKFTERVKELESYTGKSAEELGIYEPNFEHCNKPQGYMPNCPFLPCDKCHFYYGEIDSCMVGEEGVVPTEEELDKVREALGEEAARNFFAPLKPTGMMYDIENMSQEDFYSKYADNQAALNYWHDYHGEPSEFLEV